MPNLIDMKITQASAEAVESLDCCYDPYPWGLRISLDNETLKKLGIEAMEVGKVVQISAVAEVKSFGVREEDEAGTPVVSRNASLQITSLLIDGIPAAPNKTAAEVFYTKKD